MPFTMTQDGSASWNWYVTVIVTGEPGLTVPLDSLTLRLTPGGAETRNETGPLAALTVNEPVQT
jgi:hypothetical protein